MSNGHQHPSHSTGVFSRIVTVGLGLSAIGLASFIYARTSSSSSSTGRSSSSSASSSSFSASRSSPAAIRDPFLEKLEKVNKRLEDKQGDIDYDSAESAASSTASVSMHRLGMSNSTMKLARLLRDIRQLAGSERKCRDRSINVLHRIAMSRFLLLFHRSSLSRSSSTNLLKPPDLEHRELETRKEDWERAWKLLEGRQNEADELTHRLTNAKTPEDRFAHQKHMELLSSISAAGFPLPTICLSVECLLLEIASELKDKQRMWSSLTRLLRIEGAEENPGAVPSSSSFSTAVPILISQSTLQSLDRDSLFAAYAAAPLLGCWLWTFQLSQVLFAARRSPPAPGGPASGTAQIVSGSDLYEDFHASALQNPEHIDYAICSEIATQKLLRRLRSMGPGADSLLARLGLSEPPPESVLPFNEDGVISDEAAAHASPQPPHFTATMPALSGTSPQSSSSSSSTSSIAAAPLPSSKFDAPPLSAMEWCEWDLKAYSTSVETVDTSDETLKKQLFSILVAQRDALHEFAMSPTSNGSASGSESPPLSSASDHIPIAHSRKIYREGCLFHSTGFFGQAIPLVGTTIDSANGQPAFSMQGYCHVSPPLAASSAPEQEYSQFEFYSFQPAQLFSPSSDASSTPPTSLASGSITQSLVDAHADAAVAPQLLSVPSEDGHHSGLSSAFQSPVHSPTRGYPHPSASPESPGSGHVSTHLFDSASFASLHMQHFDSSALPGSELPPVTGDQKGHSPPHLSPGSTPPLSNSGLALTPIQRYAAGLGARAEIWTGLYRVIQSPTDVGSGYGEAVRPRVDVTYRISVVVERIHTTESPANDVEEEDHESDVATENE